MTKKLREDTTKAHVAFEFVALSSERCSIDGHPMREWQYALEVRDAAGAVLEPLCCRRCFKLHYRGTPVRPATLEERP